MPGRSACSPFERFNVHIKQVYKDTSQQLSLCLVEAVGAMDCRKQEGLRGPGAFHSLELSSGAGKRIHVEWKWCYLVPDGVRTTITSLQTI